MCLHKLHKSTKCVTRTKYVLLLGFCFVLAGSGLLVCFPSVLIWFWRELWTQNRHHWLTLHLEGKSSFPTLPIMSSVEISLVRQSCNFHAFFLWKVVWWAKLDWGPCCRLYKGMCPPQVMPICRVRNGAWTVSPRRKLRCSREASFALVGKIAGGLSLSFCKALFFLLINKDFH